MKKFIALCVVFAMCFSISAPACAAENELQLSENIVYDEGKVIVHGNDGNVMSFQIHEVRYGVGELDYYYNDELIRTYTLDVNQPQISATESSGERYLVDKTKVFTRPSEFRVDSPSLDTRGVRTTLGTFYYFPVEGLFIPNASIINEIVGSTYQQDWFTSEENQEFADAVAALSKEIISAVLTVVANPTNFALAVAAALLSEMISSLGGEVIGGLISIYLSEPYDIVTLEEELTAITSSANHNEEVYSYTETYVSYDGQEFDGKGYGGEPFNRENWSTKDFAETVWEDTYGRDGYSYPGLDRVILY